MSLLEAPKEQRLRRASLISEIYTEGNTYSQILRKPRFSTVSAMSLTEEPRRSVDVRNGAEEPSAISPRQPESELQTASVPV